MSSQQVEIKFPLLRMQLAGETIQVENWGGSIDDAGELNTNIARLLNDMFEEIKNKLHHELQVKVVLEGGAVVQVPVEVSLDWTLYPRATNAALAMQMGKKLKIQFGSSKHIKLWKLCHKDTVFTIPMQNQDISVLTAAGYLDGDEVTEKGVQLLDKFTQDGPKYKWGQIHVAKILIDSLATLGESIRGGPAAEYAITSKLVATRSHNSSGHSISRSWQHHKTTEEGERWLEERALWLIQEAGIEERDYMYERRQALISLLPKKALNEFLTHEIEHIRDAAKERFEQLGGRRKK